MRSGRPWHGFILDPSLRLILTTTRKPSAVSDQLLVVGHKTGFSIWTNLPHPAMPTE